MPVTTHSEGKSPAQPYTKRGSILSSPYVRYGSLELLASHADLLAKSAVSPEIAEARGYRSVEKKAELRQLGFGPSQCRVPALLIPARGATGEIVLYQIRPDVPRIQNGKAIKYETPRGSRMLLDVSPRARASLGDPLVPLFITEGARKVDAAASAGLACIGLFGVWGWRGTNAEGGKVALVDWESVALNDRQVYLVFDSDVATKPEVHASLARLKPFLETRGARVAPVYLPSAPGGAKTGLDDFLAAGGSVGELLALAGADLRTPTLRAPRTEILDASPPAIRRPLVLLGEHAYASTWLWLKSRTEEALDPKTGEIRRLDPPVVESRRVLVILRDDGLSFSDAPVPGAKGLTALDLPVRLAEPPPDDRLWSGEGAKRYLSGERADPADVFRRVTGIVNTFLDFKRSIGSQETMCELVACYILSTYLLDAFHVVGYLWLNGDRGTGKTSCLSVMTEMAYLGHLILAGGSYASLRDLADYGATLAFDDAEGVMDARRADPDKRALLLAGNRRGATVPFKEPAGERGWVTRHVSTYCPRLFSAIRLPDPVLGSRTIMIPLVRSLDADRTRASVLDHETWPCDRARLVDDLWGMALANLPLLRVCYQTAGRHARLLGRDLEPWRAILAVALWLEDKHGLVGLFERMDGLSVRYQEERGDMELPDPTRLAIEALRELHAEHAQGETLVFETSDLSERMNWLAEERDLAAGGETFTNAKRVGRLLERLRFEKAPRTSHKKRWQISTGALDDLARSYGVTEGDKAFPQHGTNGTLGTTAPESTENECTTSAMMPFVPCVPRCSGGVEDDACIPCEPGDSHDNGENGK